MSRLDDMVAAGYNEARRVATDLEMRDLRIDNPKDVTEHQLSLLQLMQGNIIDRRRMMAEMAFTDPVRFT